MTDDTDTEGARRSVSCRYWLSFATGVWRRSA
jgi:hypothetical protein